MKTSNPRLATTALLWGLVGVTGCGGGAGAAAEPMLDASGGHAGSSAGNSMTTDPETPVADAMVGEQGEESPAPEPMDAATDGAAADASTSICGIEPPDPHAAQRDACSFIVRARIADTIGDVSALRKAIEHVIIVVEENHSLDNMFGTVGHGIEGIPRDYANADANGKAVVPAHLTTACPPDIDHSEGAIKSEWDNGKMDGFARTDGAGALGYYTDDDHPFYSWAITTFATSDRYFCSLLGPTGPNRRYLYAASSADAPTLLDQLNDAGIAWKDYLAGGSMLNSTYGANYMAAHRDTYDAFLAALASGSLPPVTFLELGGGIEHPPFDIHIGENMFRDALTHLFASSLWAHTAVIFTYDEGGGFFDHVPPPTACPARASEAAYDHQGVRVPMMVVSPFARAAFVSHKSHSHTSLLRFVQAVFDLPALSGRDANSDALLDLFDFRCPPFVKAPTTLPAAHARGCSG